MTSAHGQEITKNVSARETHFSQTAPFKKFPVRIGGRMDSSTAAITTNGV